MCEWAGEVLCAFSNRLRIDVHAYDYTVYLISLHSPAFDVSLFIPYHFAEFGNKDRIFTKVSSSKTLPNHVKSFLENRAITPLFWIRLGSLN